MATAAERRPARAAAAPAIALPLLKDAGAREKRFRIDPAKGAFSCVRHMGWTRPSGRFSLRRGRYRARQPLNPKQPSAMGKSNPSLICRRLDHAAGRRSRGRPSKGWGLVANSTLAILADGAWAWRRPIFMFLTTVRLSSNDFSRQSGSIA
jgi:hypothetical protein